MKKKLLKATGLCLLSLFFQNQNAYTSPLDIPLLKEDEKRIKVTSLDGGGIRGLEELYFLREIERRLGGQGSVTEKTDYFAGTSTGGIIALALSNGLTINQCIAIYRDRGHEIFRKDGWSLWRSLKSIFVETYTDRGILRVLKEKLGTDTTLGDLETPVIVTSYDIEGGENGIPAPYIFNSSKPEYQTVRLWEAGRATSAAPTYFDPFYGIEGYSLIDGGIFVNHPGDVAIDEITSLHPLEQRDEIQTQINMISLGTGVYYKPMTRKQSRNMGKIDWAAPISSLMMQASSQETDQSLRNSLGNAYVRLNPILDRDVSLDGISPEEIHYLETKALEYIRDNPEAIDHAVALYRQ